MYVCIYTLNGILSIVRRDGSNRNDGFVYMNAINSWERYYIYVCWSYIHIHTLVIIFLKKGCEDFSGGVSYLARVRTAMHLWPDSSPGLSTVG